MQNESGLIIPATMQPQTRPMSIGDILDQTFRLFKRHFKPIATILLITQLPTLVISAIGILTATPIEGAPRDMNVPATAILQGLMRRFGAVNDMNPTVATISSILSAILNILQSLAITYAAWLGFTGQLIDVRASFSVAARRYFRLIGSSLLVALIFIPLAILAVIIPVIGTIISIVVAAGFGVRWAFISQAIIAEDKGVSGALGRSWELVRGHFWRIFGLLFLVVVLIYILALTVGGLSGFAPVLPPKVGGIVYLILNNIISIFTTPISIIASTLAYADLRVRKEGLDLELMAQQLANASSTAVSNDNTLA